MTLTHAVRIACEAAVWMLIFIPASGLAARKEKK